MFCHQPHVCRGGEHVTFYGVQSQAGDICHMTAKTDSVSCCFHPEFRMGSGLRGMTRIYREHLGTHSQSGTHRHTPAFCISERVGGASSWVAVGTLRQHL